MRGLGKKTREKVLNAKTADEAIGLLKGIVRARTSNEYEDAFQIFASHGRYTIVFKAGEKYSIRRPGLSRLEVLDFVAGLQEG